MYFNRSTCWRKMKVAICVLFAFVVCTQAAITSKWSQSLQFDYLFTTYCSLTQRRTFCFWTVHFYFVKFGVGNWNLLHGKFVIWMLRYRLSELACWTYYYVIKKIYFLCFHLNFCLAVVGVPERDLQSPHVRVVRSPQFGGFGGPYSGGFGNPYGGGFGNPYGGGFGNPSFSSSNANAAASTFNAGKF